MATVGCRERFSVLPACHVSLCAPHFPAILASQEQSSAMEVDGDSHQGIKGYYETKTEQMRVCCFFCQHFCFQLKVVVNQPRAWTCLADTQALVAEKLKNLRRLEAQRNELNAKVCFVGCFSTLSAFKPRNVIITHQPKCWLQVRMLREELVMLHEPASHVAEVVKSMGKTKVHVKVHIKIIKTKLIKTVVCIANFLGGAQRPSHCRCSPRANT